MEIDAGRTEKSKPFQVLESNYLQIKDERVNWSAEQNETALFGNVTE